LAPTRGLSAARHRRCGNREAMRLDLRKKQPESEAAARHRVMQLQVRASRLSRTGRSYLPGFAGALAAGAATGLAAGLPLALFFSSAFFFLALSRASPIAEVSFVNDVRNAKNEMCLSFRSVKRTTHLRMPFYFVTIKRDCEGILSWVVFSC